jgi:hypothetical protein
MGVGDMGVSSGRSRVADMTFQVFNRVIHPDWLAVRQHQRIARGTWEADVRIIEGGHAVIFRSGPARLSETLTGPETLLPDLGVLFHSTIRYERSASLRPGGSLQYQTCFEVERVDPEVFAHLSDEMTLDAARGHLFHRFTLANRMAPPPLTHIRIDPRAKGLLIHAFHTFPDELAIIRTQSLFEPCPTTPAR